MPSYLGEELEANPRVCLQGKATVPSRLGEELETNPFLRPSSAAIREALGAHETAVPAVHSTALLPGLLMAPCDLA